MRLAILTGLARCSRRSCQFSQTGPGSILGLPMVKVQWQGGITFEATPPSGNKIIMDGPPEPGRPSNGPTPLETLLAALAACSGMDVISILAKKRQEVTSYRVEVEGDREPGDEWPRPYLAIRVRHILSGVNLDPVAVQRAVELSDNKYCTVITTLRQSPPVTSEWQIE